MNRFFQLRPFSLVRFVSRSTASNFGLTNRERKRFFKQVSIVESTQSPTKFEVLLDKRKLKTPLGTVITIDNEILALALAQEWNQQIKNIDLPSMHLNSLINTFIDNPAKHSSTELINKIMFFLDWDTILHRSDTPDDLKELQNKNWNPILTFINKEFDTDLQTTYQLDIKDLVNQNDRKKIQKYFESFDQSSLLTILFIVEQLKSILLTICLLKQFQSIEQIASLARLETEFQISYWSNVEYYHDYEIMDTCSKIAAGYFVFYCLNNNVTRTVMVKKTV